MRDNNSRQRIAIAGLALPLLTLVLWSCTAAPPKPDEEKADASTPEQQPATTQLDVLTLPPSQYSARFNSAEQSLARFDWMQASATLQGFGERELSLQDHTYITYLQARIAFIRGDQNAAIGQLDTLHDPQINAALHYRILSFRHHMLQLQGDALGSAHLADQILRLAPPDSAAWKRNTWRNLQRAQREQLRAALPTASDARWQGWLELALIVRQNNQTLGNELQIWRQNNAGHPAAHPLPGGLDYQLQASPPVHSVALILPLSGPLAAAGKAVLEGYLAAYYTARDSGDSTFELLVFDQDNYSSASTAYDEAVKRGAGLVVGPLSKQGVADLATRLERPVPILALNHIDQVLPASGSALVQLSLAPEDEATRIAELAFGQGSRSALVVTPEGEWGRKVERALRQRWAALGGTVAASATYGDREEYSSSLKSALGLAASEQRAREIRSMLATNIEYTPRRRMDLDVVFLLSRNGAQARSIKPLLAFHYAGSLPVYALSTIYSGVPDERNRDLNGVNLVETPWLLGANPALRVAIAAGDTGGSSYTRLNALGADAFLLQSSFNRLQSGADALFRGNTGLLSMDPELRIHRELSLATFDGGVVRAQ